MAALARIWTWKTAIYVVKLACLEKSLKKLVLKALNMDFFNFFYEDFEIWTILNFGANSRLL